MDAYFLTDTPNIVTAPAQTTSGRDRQKEIGHDGTSKLTSFCLKHLQPGTNDRIECVFEIES